MQFFLFSYDLLWDDILEVEEPQPDAPQEPVIVPGGVRHVLTLVPLRPPANWSVLLQPGPLVLVAAIKIWLLFYFSILLVSSLADWELWRIDIHVKVQDGSILVRKFQM